MRSRPLANGFGKYRCSLKTDNWKGGRVSRKRDFAGLKLACGCLFGVIKIELLERWQSVPQAGFRRAQVACGCLFDVIKLKFWKSVRMVNEVPIYREKPLFTASWQLERWQSG